LTKPTLLRQDAPAQAIGARHMHVDVGGAKLWFDVEGQSVVPDGTTMRSRPTVLLIHGGPGSWDHSYFKPAFSHLAAHAQVVYLDLPGHGRSSWGTPSEWSFEGCADAIRLFCETVGITAPVVFGHSMGAPIVLLYGARHPQQPAGLIACSGFAHFDVDRLVEAVHGVAGAEVADIARRAYNHQPVKDVEWDRVYAAFGPSVPDQAMLARRRRNLDLAFHGAQLTDQLDITEQLADIRSRTLICTGALDPITPVDAAHEIADHVPTGVAELEIFDHAGHFPWLDVPEKFWSTLVQFIRSLQGRSSG